ncbi:hypothetical protein E2C01_067071 [Portunus trituberculatus]|uniref:Uncharacterized protein n=1 Tax=Portunus trituberculatus TaxID=210409 RepID=A0A5B7HVK9_PORTR|nr:hypothetical protein [Portunus trituberculatus]
MTPLMTAVLLQIFGSFSLRIFIDCANKSIHSDKLAAVRARSSVYVILALLGISPPAGDAQGRLGAMVNTGHERGRCCHNHT